MERGDNSDTLYALNCIVLRGQTSLLKEISKFPFDPWKTTSNFNEFTRCISLGFMMSARNEFHLNILLY